MLMETKKKKPDDCTGECVFEALKCLVCGRDEPKLIPILEKNLKETIH